MSYHSEQQTVVLTTICWWLKLERDWQLANKEHKDYIWRGSISRT
jgi:hypothetical protein